MTKKRAAVTVVSAASAFIWLVSVAGRSSVLLFLLAVLWGFLFSGVTEGYRRPPTPLQAEKERLRQQALAELDKEFPDWLTPVQTPEASRTAVPSEKRGLLPSMPDPTCAACAPNTCPQVVYARDFQRQDGRMPLCVTTYWGVSDDGPSSETTPDTTPSGPKTPS